MRKIINGKRYDSDTAKRIGYTDNGLLQNDFEFWCETLYRTNSGRYFIHGEGHGNSRYGEWRGNTGGWGERIIVMEEVDAKEWAERNMDADEYELAFGKLAGEKERITADLPVAIRERLDKIKGDLSYGEIITKMVNRWE